MNVNSKFDQTEFKDTLYSEQTKYKDNVPASLIKGKVNLVSPSSSLNALQRLIVFDSMVVSLPLCVA